MAIVRRAETVDLPIPARDETRGRLGPQLRRWLPIVIGALLAAAMIVMAAAAPLIAPVSPSAQTATVRSRRSAACTPLQP